MCVGGFLYWEQSGEQSASLSVEISSYMVLTTLSANPTTEDLGYANRIVRWLTTQQNYYGGFYSTQVRTNRVTPRINQTYRCLESGCVCVGHGGGPSGPGSLLPSGVQS